MLKQRQSVGKRSGNRTIADNASVQNPSHLGSPKNGMKTIELAHTIGTEHT